MSVFVILQLMNLLLGTSSADMDSASLYGTNNEKGEYTEVFAVEGRNAHLPCDLSQPSGATSSMDVRSQLRLVLWYYGAGGTPVYVYDNRKRVNGTETHWVDPAVDRTRIEFRPFAQPASLRITKVRPHDQRVYRCRVDFNDFQARNSRVNLTVITPPGMPVVLDDKGRKLNKSSFLSFSEGESASLTCSSKNGNPPSLLTWWSNEVMIDDDWQLKEDGSSHNQLTVGPLSRDHIGQKYTCRATNHVISPTRSITVTIDLTLRPLSTRILGWNDALSAGVKYQLTCQSAGSRPPADITWWMNGQQLNTTNQSHSGDMNVTTSTLSLTPTVKDADQMIRCRASNAQLSQIMDDVWKLKIRYAPVLRLKLSSSVQHGAIREGEDLYMKCQVLADPQISRIEWRFNGAQLSSSHGLGVVIANDSLALYRTPRTAAGNYSCTATNDEGTSVSPPRTVRVTYAPVCSQTEPHVIWASLGESAEVECHVTADPQPFRYIWAINSTGQLIDLPEASYSSSGGHSTCRYTARVLIDFGTLLCTAENDVGVQLKPCAVEIQHAERPESPVNCSVTMNRGRALEVGCTHRQRFGLPSTFVMEVSDSLTGDLLDNVTAEQPRFSTMLVGPGQNLMLTVYAFNAKGRSDLYITHAKTEDDLAQKVTSTSNGALSPIFEMTPILGSLIALIFLLMILAVVAVVYIRRRSTKPQRKIDIPPEINDVTRERSLDFKETFGPDIVPSESDYELEEVQTKERRGHVRFGTCEILYRGTSEQRRGTGEQRGGTRTCSTLDRRHTPRHNWREYSGTLPVPPSSRYTAVPCPSVDSLGVASTATPRSRSHSSTVATLSVGLCRSPARLSTSPSTDRATPSVSTFRNPPAVPSSRSNRRTDDRPDPRGSQRHLSSNHESPL